jgi:hypothetical protein
MSTETLELTADVRIGLWGFFGEPEPEAMAGAWPPVPDTALVRAPGKAPALRTDTPFGQAFCLWYWKTRSETPYPRHVEKIT